MTGRWGYRFALCLALIGATCIARLLLGTASAQALVDTPAHLMAKGLDQSAIGREGGWHLHCNRNWLPAGGESWWAGRCWRIHRREGHGPHRKLYNGHGIVILRLKYGLFYWSYEYDIQCVHRVESWEVEFWEEQREEWEREHAEWERKRAEAERLGRTFWQLEPTLSPEPHGWVHERLKRTQPNEVPIILH